MKLSSLLLGVYVEIKLREKPLSIEKKMIKQVGKFSKLLSKGYRWCEIKRELEKGG